MNNKNDLIDNINQMNKYLKVINSIMTFFQMNIFSRIELESVHCVIHDNEHL